MPIRTLKLFSLFGLAVLFSHCGTTESTPSTHDISVLAADSLLRSAQTKFLEYADSTGGDPRKAIEMTANYLYFEPNVQDVYTTDSTYIRIIVKSGIQVLFQFSQTDASGNYVYRGGGGGKGFSQLSPLANHTITNKKVLFFAADTKTLPAVNPQIEKGVEKISNSGLDLEVTVLRDEQCSYGVVETFKDYGLVLIDTHGEPESFRVGSVLDLSAMTSPTEDALKVAINAQLAVGAYSKVLSGELMLGAEIKGDLNNPNWHKSAIASEDRSINFTSKYVRMLPLMPSTIIFGNMCYSGTVADAVVYPKRVFVSSSGKIVTRPEQSQPVDAIGKAFISRELISYYGYTRNFPVGTSRAVPDEFGAACEDRLITRLISHKDSTGIAHTSTVLNEEVFDPEIPRQLIGDLYFRQYGHKDYSYSDCINEFTDDRDGQKYKAVCIGNQNWMAENLRFGSGDCYPEADCNKYGKLYTWPTIMNGAAPSTSNPSGVRGICPKGWHIPSHAEWMELITFVGGANAGGSLKSVTDWKSPNLGASNTYGFNALGGGQFFPDSSAFYFLNQEGYWWTTSLAPNQGSHYYAILTSGSKNIFFGNLMDGDEGYKFSCRCVKDK